MSFLRPRTVPDVPEDILEDHFNDPNYDLLPLLHSTGSSQTAFELESPRYKKLSLEVGKEPEALRPVRASTDGGHSHLSMPEFDDESPYPEVRAAVPNTDDPSIPVNTFRAWTLGLFFTVFVSGLNQFFSLRFPAVLITGIVVQLASLPLGKFLASILPRTRFRLFNSNTLCFSFNPGPFNIKEHVVITVMASSVVFGAYGTDVIATQWVAYRQRTLPVSYQFLLPLSIQLFGFALGGYLRNIVVYPASMLWPSSIVSAALFNTLHNTFPWKPTSNGRHITREKFFLLVTLASAVWYWVPGYLFTALSVANWVCWIAPNNRTANALFGSLSGLGMSVITLDWAQIAFIGSPLVTPWWSEANTAAALVICFWIIAPIIYFTNTFFTQFLPISSGHVFDNTAHHFSATDILTNGTFDSAPLLKTSIPIL
jgi:OPT family small oligopeptide transporter